MSQITGGSVVDAFGESRWLGSVENTRAFGDGRWKEVGVTAEPQVGSRVINGQEFAFMAFVRYVSMRYSCIHKDMILVVFTDTIYVCIHPFPNRDSLLVVHFISIAMECVRLSATKKSSICAVTPLRPLLLLGQSSLLQRISIHRIIARVWSFRWRDGARFGA